MDEIEQISLGSMEKLDKARVIYIQLLRINKMLSEASLESQAAIDTLECNLWADILMVGGYEEELKKIKKDADAAIEKITKNKKTFKPEERTEVERIKFTFLKNKFKLLVTIMGKRALWGEEAIEITIGGKHDNREDT